jgi:ATP-dependent exoDNAse (exonuclease V) beta subunit
MLLSEKNPHERDDLIVFDEPTHTYTIGGESGYMSATTFVHSNFPEFDEDLIIERMRSSKNWEKNKYYPMTTEEIKATWEKNRDAASAAGTKMHALIEDFYNELRDWDNLDKETDMTTEMRFFKQFREDYELEGKLVPFRTEWRVFHEELKIAGTIDMVFRNVDGTLSIVDWKRCGQIKQHVNTAFKQPTSLNPALSELYDTNYYHYQLQLNIYKHILETKYGFVVKELVLANLHPGNQGKSYEFYDVPVLSEAQIAGLYQWRASIEQD